MVENKNWQVKCQLKLCFLNQGLPLVTDNYYTSVFLVHELIQKKTHLIDTLRETGKHNP